MARPKAKLQRLLKEREELDKRITEARQLDPKLPATERLVSGLMRDACTCDYQIAKEEGKTSQAIAWSRQATEWSRAFRASAQLDILDELEDLRARLERQSEDADALKRLT